MHFRIVYHRRTGHDVVQNVVQIVAMATDAQRMAELARRHRTDIGYRDKVGYRSC